MHLYGSAKMMDESQRDMISTPFNEKWKCEGNVRWWKWTAYQNPSAKHDFLLYFVIIFFHYLENCEERIVLYSNIPM